MINISFIIICIVILIFKVFEFIFKRFSNNKLQNYNLQNEKLQNDNKLGGTIYKNKLKCQLLLTIINELLKCSNICFYVKFNNYYISVKYNELSMLNDEFNFLANNLEFKFKEINKNYYLQTEKQEYKNYDEEIKVINNFNHEFKNKINENLNIKIQIIEDKNDNKDNIKILTRCQSYNIFNFIKNNNYDPKIFDIIFNKVKDNNYGSNIIDINNIDDENIKLILYDMIIYKLIENNRLLQIYTNRYIDEYKPLNYSKYINSILNIKNFVKLIKNKQTNETNNNEQILYSYKITYNNNELNNDINILIPYQYDIPKIILKYNNDFNNNFNNNINLNNGKNYYLFNDITKDEFKIENENAKYISELKLEDKIKIVSKKFQELKEHIFNLLDIIDFYIFEYNDFNQKISQFFNKYKNNNIIDNNNNKLTIFDKINCYKFYFDNIDKTKEENKEIIDRFPDIEKKINNSPVYIYLFDFIWINIQNYLVNNLTNNIDLVVDLFKEDLKLNNVNNHDFINKIDFITIKSKDISEIKEGEENIPENILLNHFNNNVFLQNSVNSNKEFIIISFIVPGHATIILIQQKSDHFNVLFFNPHSSFDTKVDETNIYLKYFNVFLKIFGIKNSHKKINITYDNYVGYKDLQLLFERPEFLSVGMCLLTSYLFTYFMLHMSLHFELNENNISMINKYIYWYIKNQLFKCDFNYEKSLNIENDIVEEKKENNEKFNNQINNIKIITDFDMNKKIIINKNLSFLNYTETLRCKYNYAINTKNSNEIEQLTNSFNKVNYILNFGLILIKKYIHKEMIIAKNEFEEDKFNKCIDQNRKDKIFKDDAIWYIEFHSNFHIRNLTINDNEKKFLFPTFHNIIKEVSVKKYNKKLDILNDWKNWHSCDIFTWLYFIVFKVYTLHHTLNTNDLFNFILNFSKYFLNKNLNLETIFSEFESDKKFIDKLSFNLLAKEYFSALQFNLISLNNYNSVDLLNFSNYYLN